MFGVVLYFLELAFFLIAPVAILVGIACGVFWALRWVGGKRIKA